jgi:hypothetical protein
VIGKSFSDEYKIVGGSRCTNRKFVQCLATLNILD